MSSDLLNALENESNASIVELSTKKIKIQKQQIFDQLNIINEKRKCFEDKLSNYRYCNDLKDIQYGFYIRWIPLKNPEKIYITNGGHVCDIKIINNEMDKIGCCLEIPDKSFKFSQYFPSFFIEKTQAKIPRFIIM